MERDALDMTVRAATSKAIEAAAAALRAGNLVAFPTETVYGLGADATNARAVAAIFEAKGRPRFNPLIVHVPSMAAVSTLGRLTETGRKLAAAFWPGPLTLVLAKRADCPVADLATAGLSTIAVRIPAHPIGQALLREAGGADCRAEREPLGSCEPDDSAHVAADLGDRVGHDPRRRRYARWHWNRPSSTSPATRLSSCASAASRARTSRTCLGTPSRWPETRTPRHPRPACWPATTRPRPGCASTRATCVMGRLCWHSAATCPAMPARPSISAPPAISSRPPPTCSLPCARLDAAGRHGHCRHADPGVWPGRGHQRPPAACCSSAKRLIFVFDRGRSTTTPRRTWAIECWSLAARAEQGF